ncbi:MAG: AAA family ATPase [Atopobiaceae bacterium]|nr:AAA family ATPase [Atopobiaceae bacterium]
MARVVSIGRQGFEDLRINSCFYVDKTGFISDWWRAQDDVTLICRPRRFGKTLLLDTVHCFLSTDLAGRGEELFEGLEVWKDPGMRALQGTVPVVFVSFADCKGQSLEETKELMKQMLCAAVRFHGYLRESKAVDDADRAFLADVSDDMPDIAARTCLKRLCRALRAHWGVKPVVLLDEYDTPMQEAWLGGWWDGMADFVRGLFNSTFKTNPDLGRALITGITRVASESIFSDMNNPDVVTTATPKYQDACGFTQDEVDAALEEFGLQDMTSDVRDWYDGYVFGGVAGIYNPWSVTNMLDKREIDTYWAGSSSNALVSSLVRRGSTELKADFETLLDGGEVGKPAGQFVDFRSLQTSQGAVWSLLLAAGYLRLGRVEGNVPPKTYVLRLPNLEIRELFSQLVRGWFECVEGSWNAFCRSLAACDAEAMNDYLSDLASDVMSTFDSATRPSKREQPERFWHGLVLGLLVHMRATHVLRSNRESGYGRYDVMLEPRDKSACGQEGEAHVIEFKVFDSRRGEETLEDTLAHALAQIENKGYDADLVERGVDPTRIHHWGIAFQGKEALVG